MKSYRRRGQAFIVFEDQDGAIKAQTMNGFNFNEKPLVGSRSMRRNGVDNTPHPPTHAHIGTHNGCSLISASNFLSLRGLPLPRANQMSPLNVWVHLNPAQRSRCLPSLPLRECVRPPPSLTRVGASSIQRPATLSSWLEGIDYSNNAYNVLVAQRRWSVCSFLAASRLTLAPVPARWSV